MKRHKQNHRMINYMKKYRRMINCKNRETAIEVVEMEFEMIMEMVDLVDLMVLLTI